MQATILDNTSRLEEYRTVCGDDKRLFRFCGVSDESYMTLYANAAEAKPTLAPYTFGAMDGMGKRPSTTS